MKYFRMSYEEVVFKRSYLNLILLNRAIPGYKPLDEKESNSKDLNKQSKKVNVHANDFFMNFM